MTELRELVEGPSKWRPALDLGPVHLGFVVNSVALREIYLRFFPCQCHTANASYPSCFEHWSYQNDKVAQPRNLKKFNAVSEIGTVVENIDTFF